MAAVIRLSAAELPPRLEAAFKTVMQRVAIATANRMRNHIVTVLIPGETRVPVDRGIFRAGWQARAAPDGAVVYNAAPHAAFVEYGVQAQNVKPGRAMIDALAAWVIRKRIVNKKGGSPAAKAGQEAEARQVAWAIAMSMQSKGIFNRGKGLRFLERATKMVPKWVSEEIAREVARMKL